MSLVSEAIERDRPFDSQNCGLVDIRDWMFWFSILLAVLPFTTGISSFPRLRSSAPYASLLSQPTPTNANGVGAEALRSLSPNIGA